MAERWTIYRVRALGAVGEWQVERDDERPSPFPVVDRIEVVPAEHADTLANRIEDLLAGHLGGYDGLERELHSALTTYRQATPAFTGQESE